MVIAYVLFAGVGAAAAQPCTGYWLRPPAPVGDAGRFGGRSASFDDGSGPALYAQCSDIVGGWPHAEMSCWRGHVWQRLNQGLPSTLSSIFAILVLDDGTGPKVYVGGGSDVPQFSGMWAWTGSAWQPTPQGFFYSNSSTGDSARPYCSFNDGTGSAIYGQAFLDSLDRFAKWNGQEWIGISPLFLFERFQMQTLDLGDGPAIYLAGFYSMPDFPQATGIAKWDGHSLTALGSGLDGSSHDVQSLAVYDDGHGRELYVGGWFTQAGGLVVNGLAKWNGQRWAAVPGYQGPGVRSMCVFDDGSGPALFVCGDFTSVGGQSARHIAKFDGTTWTPLGAGVPANSNYLAAFPTDPRGPSLFVWASGAGSVGGSSVIQSGDYQWVGCPNCYANCDNSTQSPALNVLDFICFLNKFAARDPYANCTVDATIDVNDFVCFLSKFAAGCP